MHIIVNNYSINGKNFEYLQKKFKQRIKFDYKLYFNSESLFYPLAVEKYQIKINKYLDKEYVSSFFEDQTIKFPLWFKI